MFKQKYTKEEADELLHWIDSKPTGSLNLGEGVNISDIAKFCSQMRAIVQNRYNNPAFAGQIEILARLKQAYTQQNQTT